MLKQIVIVLLFFTGMRSAYAHTNQPSIKMVGSSYVADDGAVCMNHQDDTHGPIILCLKSFRLQRSTTPITSRGKFTKCLANLRINQNGDVTRVKIEKFKGVHGVKNGCRRTMIGLKFHPVKTVDGTSVNITGVEQSLFYQFYSIKEVRRVSYRYRFFMGDGWDLNEDVFNMPFTTILTSSGVVPSKAN